MDMYIYIKQKSENKYVNTLQALDDIIIFVFPRILELRNNLVIEKAIKIKVIKIGKHNREKQCITFNCYGYCI